MEQNHPPPSAQELLAWNENRRQLARRWKIPFVPVLDDREAPAVDEDLIRGLLTKKLTPARASKVAGFCWMYPAWIQAYAHLAAEYALRDRPLEDGEKPPA